ncbi:hypothetical protein IFM89_017774 [Coptis chinensis]|uniref:Protein kinase domain-containing protein n=1 Tax=Coptis chinensis TaxID=261450 RepID=A0A835HZ64_9MAGN|nr:hypothetical protein IFM89_017774 [Coptis chinensis]
MDLKGIIGISHGGSDSGSDMSMFSTVEKGRAKEFEKKASYGHENRTYYDSLRLGPRTLSRNGSSQNFSHGYASSGASDSSSSKIKFLCSFGGKILPRPSDGRLRYVGGDTRIIRISKSISWQELLQKTVLIFNQAHTIKYQLPGEDLDALVSVSCDEDLQNMLEECSVLEHGSQSQKPRMFLVSTSELDDPHFGLGSMDGDSEMQYVVAVNGMDLGPKTNSSGQLASTSANDLDQLLGLNAESEMSRAARDSTRTSAFPFASSPAPPTTTAHILTEGLHSATSVPEKGAQPELQNRLSKSDDSFGSQLRMSHSRSGVSQQEPITESVDKVNEVNLASQMEPSVSSEKPLQAPRVEEGLEQLEKFKELANTISTKSAHELKSESKNSELNSPGTITMDDQNIIKMDGVYQESDICKPQDTFVNDGGPARVRTNLKEVSHDESKTAEINSSARQVGASTKDAPQVEPSVAKRSARERGDILIDINDRFPRDFLSDIFSKERSTEDSSSISPLYSDGTGLSMNMENHDPKHWSFFQNLAQDEFVRNDVSLMDQDHLGYSSPLTKVDEGSSGAYNFPQLTTDVNALGPVDSQIFFEEEIQQEPSVASQVKGTEFVQFDEMSYAKTGENPGTPESDYEDGKLRNDDFGGSLLNSSLGEFDINLQLPQAIRSHACGTTNSSTSNTSSFSIATLTCREFCPTPKGFYHFSILSALTSSSWASINGLSNLETVIGPGTDAAASISLSERLEMGPSKAFPLKIIKNEDLEELKELGSGTFGTVYHGKWRGTDVAIKRIKKSCFTGRSSEQERLTVEFWREADILSKLHHPNVVAFYGVVQNGPGATLATVAEFMVNGSLRHVLLRKDRYLDRRKRLIIAMDAAFGMEYLHSKNIVHFDLKCDNLLVNLKDPQRPICKVGDFGLSKIKRNTLVTGGVRGTLPWMAPELLNGSSSKVSEKVDVFSFGIVLWEILTGEEPYANMHYGAIIGGIVSNTLRPPVPSFCDSEWKRLMEECWAPDPVARPSFTEIASRLRVMSSKAPSK